MWEDEFIGKYNALIGRMNKAHELLEKNPNAFDNSKYLNEYNKIIIELGKMNKRYEKRFGQPINNSEKFNGFY